MTGFSGMDVAGTLMIGHPVDRHMEHWMFGAQFKLHITQAFWVPQHGMAGWIGAEKHGLFDPLPWKGVDPVPAINERH